MDPLGLHDDDQHRRTVDHSALNRLAESAVTRLASRAALFLVASVVAWVGMGIRDTMEKLSDKQNIMDGRGIAHSVTIQDHERRLGTLENRSRHRNSDLN